MSKITDPSRQYAMLCSIRGNIYTIAAYRKTLPEACFQEGVEVRVAMRWARAHGLRLNRSKPRSLSQLRVLLIAAYRPWVPDADLSRDMGYRSPTGLRDISFRYSIPSYLSPWVTPPPRIPYMDALDIMPLILEHESMYIVAEKSGYSVVELNQVFGIATEVKVRSKIKPHR